MKKTLILSSLFFLMISSLNAQEWLTNIDSAKVTAAEKNRNIILVFQGSDWCAPCIKLERDIWSSEEFKSYAKDNFVMLLADFPRKKKNKLDKKQENKNKALAEKYNKSGMFPYVIVLDKDGKVLGSTGYKKISPAEYIKLLSSY